MSAWTDHVAKWKDCQLCPLCRQRDRICLARGQVPADVVFVGEAPGASEDAIGLPFYGPAGDLLQQIIDRVIDSTPDWTSYALANIVACFPREAKGRGDNEPEPSEIRACRPRLVEFLDLCHPRLVVTVGTLARDWIPRSDAVKWCHIVHPASILRMPLAQKGMAVQKCIVQLRCAIQNMLQSKQVQDGDSYANFSDTNEPKHSDDDIPF